MKTAGDTIDDYGKKKEKSALTENNRFEILSSIKKKKKTFP